MRRRHSVLFVGLSPALLLLAVAACGVQVSDHPRPAEPSAGAGDGGDSGPGPQDAAARTEAGGGDAASGATPVTCPVDPAVIYMTGYLAGSEGGGNAIAPVSSPTSVCYPLKEPFVGIRSTDKALLFVDAKKDVRKFQATTLVKLASGKWGYDANHVDPLVTSPCGAAATNAIWVRPTGEVLFACGTTFKWADGTTFDTGGLYPRALSATQAFLVDTSNTNHCKVKAFTGETSPELSLGTKLWAYSKATADGFDVVTYDLADVDGSQAHELWHVTLTAATKVGDFVAKPADAPTGRLATNVVLDNNRLLYEHAAGSAVWTRPLTGTAAIVYKVPTGGTFDWTVNPPKTTFVSNGIFTGP